MTQMREHPLPAWSYRKPVTVGMIFISIIVVGIIAEFRLPLEFAPDFSNRYMWIWVPNLNSTPIETDQKIGTVLEDELKQLRHLKRIEVSSSPQGCSVSLEFQNGCDMNIVSMDARDACERAKSHFPDSAGQIGIHQNKSTNWPILWMGVESNRSSDDLYRILNDRVKPALERIAGVALVELHGYEPENLFIDLELNRMRALGVDIAGLSRDLMEANRNPSIGTLMGPLGTSIVRGQFRLNSIDEYRHLPIQNGRLELSDIADIDFRMPESNTIYRINGRTGVSISVQKNSMSNTVEVFKKVQEALDLFRSDPDFHEMNFSYFFNQAGWITNSLSNLRNAGIWGGVFAAVILFLFLRHFGAMCIILISVPVSILAALIALYGFHYSLNIGTLMGLMLAIGMLVDNSIVVSENIFRLRNMGYEPVKASISGAGSMGTAITASTLTTIIVFIPLVFAKGEMGIWMKQIGMPITFSLLASLLIALTFVPLASIKLLKSTRKSPSRLIYFLNRLYVRLLRLILSHRLTSFLVVAVFFASIAIPISKVEKNMQGGGGERQLFMRVMLPSNYRLDEADVMLSRFESILLENKANLNLKNISTSYRDEELHIRLFLEDSGNDLMTEGEIKTKIKSLIPIFPGITWWFGWQGNEASDKQQVDIALEGNSSSRLIELADELKPLLLTLPSISEVHANYSQPMDEIHIKIDRGRSNRNGVSAFQIAHTISTMVMGRPLPRFQRNDEEVEVRLQLNRNDRESIQQLQNILMFNESGMGVPIKNLASFEIQPGSGTIQRIDGKIQHIIQIETKDKDIQVVRDQVTKLMNQNPLPTGYSWSFGRSFQNFDLGMKELLQTFVLALILVILLLGSLFESLIQPFIIILSLPFALVGVYWTLYITNTVQDIMANIGLVILIGIVVNNAIVLLDHINRLRSEGKSRSDALIQAGEDRFRPIVMTASTTLLGLVPLAFSKTSASGQFYASLAITVMGGLAVSTILTLCVIPLFYDFADDFQHTLKRFFNSLFPNQRNQSSQ